MKIKLMIIKRIKLLIVLFILLMSNQILASVIDVNDMTLKEAIEYSQSGNPIDVVLDYCKENNLYGAKTFAEEFGDGEWVEVYSKLGNIEIINKTIENGIEALEEKHKSEQKDEIYVVNRNQIHIYVILCIFIVLLLISVFKKKRMFVTLSGIVSIILIILIVVNFMKMIKKNNLYDDTLKLLNNIDDKKAEESLNLDKEINVSHAINDYLIKVWYCAKCKAENIDLFDNDIFNSNSIFEEPIIFYDDYIDVDENYVDKLDYYGKMIVTDWTGRDYPIQRAGISKEAIKGIYDNLTDEDIANYKNKTLIDKLVVELKNKIKYREHTDKMFERESLTDYIAIIAQGTVCFLSKNIDDEVKRNYKYWYLDGENRTIELPYGVYLKYEKQEVEKIDNVKWIYTNINEIDYINDDNVLYAYYIKDNKLYGDYAVTEIENEKILFNPYELTHKIKKARISLTLDKDFEFNNKNPLKESDMWRLDDKKINLVTFENGSGVNEKTCGTERDLSLISCLIDGRELYERYICSDNFNKKYDENQKKIIQNNPKNYDNVFVSIDVNKPDKMLRKLILDDGTEIYFLFKVYWLDGIVDDIEMYKVPIEYNNLPPDEMYQLAFND